jgi:hypothetical protein
VRSSGLLRDGGLARLLWQGNVSLVSEAHQGPDERLRALVEHPGSRFIHSPLNPDNQFNPASVLYSCSTNGISFSRPKSPMKGFAWIGAGLLILLMSGASSSPRFYGTIDALARAWWVLPVFASLGSLLALEGALVLGWFGRIKQSAVPTGAYLISGPSVAAFNLSAFIPQSAPPPSWVGGLMLALLLGSAWAYFLSSKDELKETGKRSGNSPPFQLTSG